MLDFRLDYLALCLCVGCLGELTRDGSKFVDGLRDMRGKPVYNRCNEHQHYYRGANDEKKNQHALRKRIFLQLVYEVSYECGALTKDKYERSVVSVRHIDDCVVVVTFFDWNFLIRCGEEPR